MRPSVIIVAATAVTLAAASLALPERRPLVWNLTRSVPTGLYWITEADQLSVGDTVAIDPPPTLRRILARRGYLPRNVPLLKRIAAARGQQVCRFRHGVTIDGRLVALARARDTLGRPLPRWGGCRTLGKREFFTLNPSEQDSFDGRYFGILGARSIIGRAVPLLTDERGDGHLVQPADPESVHPPFPGWEN